MISPMVRTKRRSWWLLLPALLALLLPSAVAAQQESPDAVMDGVAFEQKLNAQVPLDLEFVDDMGTTRRLGDLIGADGRPTILVLGYYECPMLCSLVREGTLAALQQVTLSAGRDFSVVNVSIDPLETPMTANTLKTVTMQRYAREGAADDWHFLTGRDEAIRELADSVGFQYVYDETIDQYAHAAGIIVLTPDGRAARYLYGIEYSPGDLRLALVEAAEGKIGNPVDQFMLLCYQYNPVTGSYTPAIMTILRIAGVITVVTLVVGIYLLSRTSPEGKTTSPGGPAVAQG